MGILKKLQSIVNVVKEVLFPLFCIVCGAEGEFVCGECFESISLEGVMCCPMCHKVNADGGCCASCADASYIERHISATTYKDDSLVKKLLHAYKYEYVDVESFLFRVVEVFCLLNPDLFADVDIVVPIPLHRRRFVERGFNQSLILAHAVASILDVPMWQHLNRKRYTKQQARLSRSDRQKNLDNAFVYAGDPPSPGSCVLLVDDVFTTGSTIQAAAAAFFAKESNIRVFGFSLARG